MSSKWLPILAGLALGLPAVAAAGSDTSASARQSGARATPGVMAVAPAHVARSTHRFRGTVTSSNTGHRWFNMRTTTNRRVRIHTNHTTHWDGCDWGDMRSGHHVDVRAYRSHHRWVAATMSNWHDWNDWHMGHMAR